MTAAAPRLTYRPELDGLRCVAVILVIVHHVWQPHRFAGFVGVDVFFVLSGYLITTILLGELSSTGSLRLGRFYLRRALRLYPALLAMLVVTFPLYGLLTNDSSLLTQGKRAVIAATYTGNLYMTYWHDWLGPYTHTWSLAMEEQYYLVWPLLLVALLRVGLRSRNLVGLLAVAVVVSSVFCIREFSFGASSFPIQSTSVGLLTGSALGVLLSRSDRARRIAGNRAVGAGGVALLVTLLVLFSLTTALPDGSYVLASVLATASIIAYTTSAAPGWLVHGLSVRPVVSLGRVSYGVYLWHYPIVLLCARWLGDWSPWLRLLLVAPSAFAIAYLSYAYLESPFLRLKNRIGRGVDSTRPALPDVTGPDPMPAAAGPSRGRRNG